MMTMAKMMMAKMMMTRMVMMMAIISVMPMVVMERLRWTYDRAPRKNRTATHQW